MDLQEQRLQLINDIQNISLQLSDKDKRSSTGARMTKDEYSNWRKKAIGALRQKESKLREVKKALYEASKAPAADCGALEDELDEAERLLKAALDVFSTAKKENVVFRDEEESVFGQIEVFLSRNDSDEDEEETE